VGMMNICESVIKIVNGNKPKWLSGLSQNGDGEWRFASILRPRGHYSPPVDSRHLTPRTSQGGTWKPRNAPDPGLDSGLRNPPMAVRAWDAGKSECRAIMAWIRGFNIPRRESEQTSGGSFMAREFDRTVCMRESK